jgi:hypothetical protein
MPGELHELSVAIGELQAEMRILSQTVHDNQVTATAEHREVHNIVVAMSESVRIIAAKVDKMEPLTEDYREERAEARGADKLKAKLYAGALAIGGVFGALLGKLIELVAKKFGS